MIQMHNTDLLKSLPKAFGEVQHTSFVRSRKESARK